MQSIISEHKPHFYEYMQIQLLQSYIQKGITYFVNSILNASPKFIQLRYYSEEISFVIDFIKDFLCLKMYGGTYAEQFYGLERVGLFNQLSEGKSGKNLKLLYHTLVMTLVPYLLHKLEAYYNTLVEEQANEGRILNFVQKVLTKLYPYLHMLFTAVQVLMKFRYLLEKQEKVFDLYYKVSGTRLRYQQKMMDKRMGDGKKTHYPWMDLVKTPGLLAIVIGHKVMSWYFTRNRNQDGRNIMQEEGKNASIIGKYVSPLKANLESNTKQIKQKQKKQYTRGICLICSNQITNPTVVKQNGHVYCYECISEYVRENGKCPITGIKVAPQGLQLVYSSG